MVDWILLRGLMRDARHWHDFPVRLRSELGARSTQCIDFAGNGHFAHLNSATSVGEMVEHARAQRALNTPQYHDGSTWILAMSLGAMVALEWAQRYPDEIAGLILINTSCAPYNAFYHRLRPQNYLQLARMLTLTNLHEREKIILQLTSRRFKRTLDTADGRALLSQWTEFANHAATSRPNILRQLTAAARFKCPQAPEHCPVLLLNSLGDQLVYPLSSETLAQQWHVPLRTHPSAGHDIPLDDPDWIIQTLQEKHRL